MTDVFNPAKIEDAKGFVKERKKHRICLKLKERLVI
jgi:hypothetical protein